jgi:hypothetical protein
MSDELNDNKKLIDDATNDLKQANERAMAFLDEVDIIIADLDLKYEKIKLEDDINSLKMAKEIVKKRWAIKDNN